MALDMRDTTEILHKIRKALNRKTYTTLEVNGNNGPGISFEQIREFHQTIPASPDEMFGDQLLGHPLVKEMREAKEEKGK